MSGGVDSSVVAAYLLEQGYEVIGITMQLWDHGDSMAAGGKTCCALDDVYDARQVASRLGIPFYVVNMESLFHQAVVRDFIETYRKGQTPNPCVRCNQVLKFEALLEKAKALGADFLATGHYAIQKTSSNGFPRLYRGVDQNKDQSYFLFATTVVQLKFLRFPLGTLTKAQTRTLAEKYDLHVAKKQESQDVCFVPDGNYDAFFKTHAPEALLPGPIVDHNGVHLGNHKGLSCYTVGQRRGLGVSAPHPLYVIAIVPETNTLVVGSDDALMGSRLTLSRYNWLGDSSPVEDQRILAKIRYAAQPQPARLKNWQDIGLEVIFDQPQRAIAPGQACVFYDESDRVLGGGWIDPLFG
ncbi:MAG: tRNA 2-thiouridine(34) synthase MnmA [Magnetococcales bacterium]|nr:tRNA 2-thiouridine(34) synthase MnmA [Magnetococcales bacterium]